MTSRDSAAPPILDPETRPGLGHEHGWVTESRHATSQGELRYVRCAGCGAHRLDLFEPGGLVGLALSHVVGEGTQATG
jgi:hypothetical protein